MLLLANPIKMGTADSIKRACIIGTMLLGAGRALAAVVAADFAAPAATIRGVWTVNGDFIVLAVEVHLRPLRSASLRMKSFFKLQTLTRE